MNGPAASGRVVVVLGASDPALDAVLAGIGLARVVEVDGNVIWGPPPSPAVTPAAAGSRRRLLTVLEAAEALSIGRSSVYELIGRGELRVVHVGRSARIPLEEVDRLVAALSDAEAPGRRQVSA